METTPQGLSSCTPYLSQFTQKWPYHIWPNCVMKALKACMLPWEIPTGHSGKGSIREALAISASAGNGGLGSLPCKEQSVLNCAPAHLGSGLGLLSERLTHSFFFLPVFFLRNKQKTKQNEHSRSLSHTHTHTHTQTLLKFKVDLSLNLCFWEAVLKNY